MTNEQVAMRVSRNSMIVNALLAVFKLLAGIFAHSAAMLSDAVHTLSDLLSTVIVMLGIRLAGKAADDDHPYGHERLECVAAIVLSILLGATGLGIGYSGVQKILQGNFGALETPGLLALVAAVVSVVVKEAMYWYARAAAHRIASGALMADAWHHRSDALSSIGSFVGILGARMGLPAMDVLASLVICVLIVKASVDIFVDATGKMTDKACDDATIQTIREIALSQPDVLAVDLLQTRLFGDKIYVDMEILVNGDVLLRESHAIAHRVHDAVEKALPRVKHCMVHVNPSE